MSERSEQLKNDQVDLQTESNEASGNKIVYRAVQSII
jgi:hypothetical protein